MDDLQLILMGKGLLARTKPVKCIPWRGVEKPPPVPYCFDPAEAKAYRDQHGG